MDDITKTSNLSAEAQEFYPRGYQAGSGFQPQGDTVESAVEQLKSAMHELTMNPGEFDNVVMPLGDAFSQWLSQTNITQSIISEIVEHAISEPNFRYTGARLLNLLNNLDTAGDTFRAALIQTCHTENENVREQLSTCPSRVHSFTLFLAEVFIQLEVKKGSGASKIAVLGETLFDDLALLLSQPDNENVKCACQVLKLAGMHLEKDVSIPKMEGLESQLESALTSPSVGPNMRSLAQNVLSLRRHAWGRSNNSPGSHQPAATPWSTAQDQPPANHFLNEAVFYGPDGQVLTAEESRFLQEGFNAGDDGGSDGEYDEGMDEEIQAAYEQFLQLPPNST